MLHRAMFNKYQNVFRSRWKALFWAGGVLLTAYCTVPGNDEVDDPTSAADAAALASVIGNGAPAPEPTHVNPWALDPPAHGAGRKG
jgi:hypothetical protein